MNVDATFFLKKSKNKHSMQLRRILIVTLGCLVLNYPCFAQILSSEQSLLSQKIETFLKEEGFRPEKSAEGVYVFEYEELKLVIRIDPNENNPMFVTMSAIFELPTEYSPKIVAIAANELNGIKGIKVLSYNDSFSVQTDMFLTNVGTFTDVFYTMIRQIQTALGSFADSYSKASSGELSPNSGRHVDNTRSTGSTNTTSSTRLTKSAEGVYNNPRVTGQLATGAKIRRVVITDEYTCVELSSNSTSSGETAEWCNIDSNTYIVNEDKPFEKLKLTRASGIKIAPDKTYYGGANRTVSFKLYFPPIPKDTKSISLIEPDSSWCFYGITLHK